MALIEKIRMRPRTTPNRIDPQVHDQDVDPTASALYLQGSDLWSLPGLRIRSRATTSSLSDYATFDLRQIAGGEFNAMITDGSSS